MPYIFFTAFEFWHLDLCRFSSHYLRKSPFVKYKFSKDFNLTFPLVLVFLFVLFFYFTDFGYACNYAVVCYIHSGLVSESQTNFWCNRIWHAIFLNLKKSNLHNISYCIHIIRVFQCKTFCSGKCFMARNLNEMSLHF